MRERDDHAPKHRLAPQNPALPCEEKQAERDAAGPIDHQKRQRATDADRRVDRSHLLVPAREGVRGFDEVRQLGQRVAARHQAQTESPLAQPAIGAFVHERVIDPAAGPPVLRLLDRLNLREVDTPLSHGRRLGDLACCLRRERRPGCLLAEPLGEPVGRAVGREGEDDFVLLTLFEVPHPPAIRREEPVADQRSERRLAAALELDEGLHRFVQREGSRVLEVGRTQVALAGQRACARKRRLTIHADID